MNDDTDRYLNPRAEVWLFVDLEFSAHAAMHAAIEAAQRRRVPLRILAVSGVEDDGMETPDLRARLEAIFREELRDRLAELASFAATSLGEHMVRVEMLEGEVAWHTLVGHAGSRAPALIVVATDPSVEEEPLGSTCRHLARKCPSPLWCVPKLASTRVGRVLVAVDATLADGSTNAASRSLLAFVATLFQSEVELHVVHAWHVRPIPNMEAHFGASVTAPLIQARREEARVALTALVEETLGAREVTLHCLQGDAGIVVPALAARLNADVVALGNTARHSLPGFLIGRTAETMIGRLRCGVMVVKAPGFKSPVPPISEIF